MPLARERPLPDDPIGSVRRYNRFYTRRLGLLGPHLPASPWSLAEARVLFELAHRDAPPARALVRDLGLDAGYLSRILRRFEAAGLIERWRDKNDARVSHIRLTPVGRKTFARLDRDTNAEVGRLLAPLPAPARASLVASMATIERLLDESDAAREVKLREPAPGDIGWVVERHGALYAREHGYDATFEGLVAKIAGEFLASHDPARERGFIAEAGGERVGAVFVVRASDEVAKLRLLFVEPEARGRGAGSKLVDACTTFAQAAGYRQITLWTQSHLMAARRLYEAAGYLLVKSEPHHSFGLDLVAETWTLELKGQTRLLSAPS